MSNSYISRLFGKNFSRDSLIGLSQAAHDNLIQLESNKAGIDDTLQALENYLNYLYYGTPRDEIRRRKAHAHFEKAVQKQMDELIKKYNPGYSPGKIPVNENMRKTHKTQISLKTLQEERDLIDQQLIDFPTSAQYKKTYQKLQILESKISSLINLATGNQTSIRKTSKTANLIDDIDSLWQEVTYVGRAVPLSEIGTLFEAGVAVSEQNLGRQIDYSVQDILKMLQSVKTDGEKRVSGNKIFMDGVEVVAQTLYKENSSGRNFGYNAYVFSDGGGSIEVHVNSINNFKQKMDVLYTFPDENQNPQIFRTSEKSWYEKNSRKGLGSTDLLSALLRTTGNVDMPLAFGLQANYFKANNWDTSNLHRWAKKVAILDIVAGIGQRQGFADTLIVQSRSERKISVYKISDIVSKVLNGEEREFYLKGYEADRIESVGFDFKRRLSGQNYLTSILSKIQGQQISISHR